MARILMLWSGCVAMLPLPLKPNVAAPGATWWRSQSDSGLGHARVPWLAFSIPAADRSKRM